jgi:uncharacterized membrane protein YfcA
MDLQIIVLFVAIGGLAGFFAGLFGVGGGFILVPPLLYLFQYQQIHLDQLMHVVIATSLAVTAITSLGSAFGHYRKSAVNFHLLRNYLGGLLLGCVSGAFVANLLPSSILRLIFIGAIFLIGLYFIFFALPSVKHSWPLFTLNLFGFLIGNLSSMLGIGGGIFSVPLLLWYKQSMPTAVGTSSAATLATVWLGSLTYLILAPPLPSGSIVFGYIDIPAFIVLSSASLATVQFGVKVAHIAPVNVLKRVFGVMLLLTGVIMLLSTSGKKKVEQLVPATGTFFLFDNSGRSFFDLKVDLRIVKPGR